MKKSHKGLFIGGIVALSCVLTSSVFAVTARYSGTCNNYFNTTSTIGGVVGNMGTDKVVVGNKDYWHSQILSNNGPVQSSTNLMSPNTTKRQGLNDTRLISGTLCYLRVNNTAGGSALIISSNTNTYWAID